MNQAGLVAVLAGAFGMWLAPGLVPGTPTYSVKADAKFPARTRRSAACRG